MTLGAYAWDDTNKSKCGGSDVGSVLHDFGEPNQQSWVEKIFLGNPSEIMCSQKYVGEETLLELLNKLAAEGGSRHFKVQDKAIQAGAAWLREFAVRSSPKAATILGRQSFNSHSDFDRRKRKAQERALKMMQARQANFNSAFMTQAEDSESKQTEESNHTSTNEYDNTYRDISQTARHKDQRMQLNDEDDEDDELKQSGHLLDRPQCIICGGENSAYTVSAIQDGEHCRKVLAYCGLVQPSVILKGGGGIPSDDINVSNHVGVHMSLCGHAVHTTCCNSHLNDMLSQESGLIDRNHHEFRCPLCRRLSNCLVPVIDVGKAWIIKKNIHTRTDPFESHLHEFLCQTKWWARNDNEVVWDGRCTFNRTDSSWNECATELKGKKEIYKAWNSVLATTAFISGDNAVQPSTPSSLPISQSERHSLSPITDAWKRVIDLITDISYKTDLKRLGEERLSCDFGEFRHHMSEKFVFNEERRFAGLEPNLVSNPSDYYHTSMHLYLTLMSYTHSSTVSEKSRQGLSKERLISKIFNAIQSLTYSCCSEELEFKRQAKLQSSSEGEPNTKFGISKLNCTGNLIILPNVLESTDNERELYSGRIGRLRYFALSVMITTSPLSREIVQLALELPINKSNEPDEVHPRAPIVFPILCGHVLTHVVAALCALCGHEGTKKHVSCHSSLADSDHVEECKHFVKLGYIAKVLQVALGYIQQHFVNKYSGLNWMKLEKQILGAISTLIKSDLDKLDAWERACFQLIQVALQTTPRSDVCTSEMNKEILLDSIRSAKRAGYQYLCSATLILQVLAPSFVLNSTGQNDDQQYNEEWLYEVMNISLAGMLNSSVVCEIIRNWYSASRPRIQLNALQKRLDCPFKFRAYDWPCMYDDRGESGRSNNISSSTSLPLLQGFLQIGRAKSETPRIKVLPISYTDLYAELNRIARNCFESISVCLVCGEVSLNQMIERMLQRLGASNIQLSLLFISLIRF